MVIDINNTFNLAPRLTVARDSRHILWLLVLGYGLQLVLWKGLHVVLG